MSGKRRMPKCVGHYDVGDVTCDGDPKGGTDDDRMPCVFRDRCAALQQHCKAKGHQPEDYVKLKKFEDDDGDKRTYAVSKADDETFVAQLAKWAKRWGVKNGKVANKKPAKDVKTKPTRPKAKTKDARPRKPPTADARAAAKKVLAAQAKASLSEAYEVSAWFTKCLQENTGRPVVERASEATAGQLFVVDRMESSRYASVYCRVGKKKRLPIACIYPHTRASTSQIRFAADAEAFNGALSAEHRSALDVVSINDGRFKTRTGKLDREGLAIAAEAIAALIKSGNIRLPPE